MSTVRFVGRRTRGRPQTRLMYVLKEDTERAGVTEEAEMEAELWQQEQLKEGRMYLKPKACKYKTSFSFSPQL